MAKRCPSCGESEAGEKFIKNFCKYCFSKNFPLVELPEVIEISRCSVCGRIKVAHDWIDENKETLSGVISTKLKSDYSPHLTSISLRQQHTGFLTSIVIKLAVDGQVVELQRTILIKFIATQCFDCSREQGGYYDSIIQLRSAEDTVYPVEKMKAKLKKIERLVGERGGYVRKVEEVETGFDMFVAGITQALQASHDVCEKVKHTRKLIGRKNNKDLYRHTFCLRF